MMDEKNVIDDGGPAFPVPDGTRYVKEHFNGHGESEVLSRVSAKGLSIRDWFAGMAMQGLLSNSGEHYGYQEGLERTAYQIADAMLEARKVTK
jgi:hypothetical protein